MTDYREYYFPSSDGQTKLHVNCWTPGQVIGVVQIAHGIAEYGQRYEAFARFLCEHGYAVVANDHLGHGKSRIEHKPPLFFGEEQGWTHVVDDIEALRARTAAEFPGVPYFLFGHSMGSFLSRTYLIRYPGRVDGCVLCGTGNPGTLAISAARYVVAKEVKRLGKAGYSPKAERLIFGSYNHRFAPNRTEYDWLSASQENVDAYLDDPMCGGAISVGLLQDLLEGLWFVTRKQNLKRMDKTTPVLFIAGEEDPVGSMGHGVRRAYRSFLAAGMVNPALDLYKGLRHEILNEADGKTVYEDVLVWLNLERMMAKKDET